MKRGITASFRTVVASLFAVFATGFLPVTAAYAAPPSTTPGAAHAAAPDTTNSNGQAETQEAPAANPSAQNRASQSQTVQQTPAAQHQAAQSSQPGASPIAHQSTSTHPQQLPAQANAKAIENTSTVHGQGGSESSEHGQGSDHHDTDHQGKAGQEHGQGGNEEHPHNNGDNDHGKDHQKIRICHATGSQSNPYVMITVDVAGAYNGHMGHQDGRDIIPSFFFNGHAYSQNWPQGQYTYNNHCQKHSGHEHHQDLCKNIPGEQSHVPNGMYRDSHGNCYVKHEHREDVCKNLPGNQKYVPHGMYRDSHGNCYAKHYHGGHGGGNCGCENGGGQGGGEQSGGGEVSTPGVTPPAGGMGGGEVLGAATTVASAMPSTPQVLGAAAVGGFGVGEELANTGDSSLATLILGLGAIILALATALATRKQRA